ncbi:hypothetical protein MUP77_03000, partial [Candidatus Bathyarchaeota archaeon]|nr:hypothetical protein [Candidatus Bathyarchaeota archaeon]
MNVPSISDFRECVDAIPSEKAKYIIKLVYLTGSRPSELVTKTCPSDLSSVVKKPYGRYKEGDLVSHTKPYGQYMKIEMQNFKYKSPTGEPKVEKALVL